MGAKSVAKAYAKSKTAWGGLVLYLISMVNIPVSGASHTYGFAVDGVIYSLPFNLTGLLASLATAAFGWLLYGRGTAKGPLVASALRRAADCLESQPVSQQIDSNPGQVPGGGS